jgi:hypothetical protein
VRASALGDPARFARDFYAMLAAALAAPQASG